MGGKHVILISSVYFVFTDHSRQCRQCTQWAAELPLQFWWAPSTNTHTQAIWKDPIMFHHFTARSLILTARRSVYSNCNYASVVRAYRYHTFCARAVTTSVSNWNAMTSREEPPWCTLSIQDVYITIPWPMWLCMCMRTSKHFLFPKRWASRRVVWNQQARWVARVPRPR